MGLRFRASTFVPQACVGLRRIISVLLVTRIALREVFPVAASVCV